MTDAVVPVVSLLGDEAILVTFGDRVDRHIANVVWQHARAITDARIVGVLEVVVAFASLAVYFDPALTSAGALVTAIGSATSGALMHATWSTDRLVRIPVRYDGPDLAEVAERTGLTVREVIERHSAPTYYAYSLGFAPGFAYLGDLDPALVLPRRPSPRPRVPAGSVAIAGAQTAVYPLTTPGGWHLIGRTDGVMFDAKRQPASAILPGDAVQFVPVAE